MGAGKSTMLKKLSVDPQCYGYSFYDLDQEVFKKYGKNFLNLGELIESKGFGWFRKAEYNLLKDIWNSSKSYVALGGGTLTCEVLGFIQSREDIEGRYLDTSFETCLSRIRGSERPLARLSSEKLRNLYIERLKSYQLFKTF